MAGGRGLGSALEDARERRGGRIRGGARHTERSARLSAHARAPALFSDAAGAGAADCSASRARGHGMHEDDTGTVGTTVGVGNGRNVGWASLESPRLWRRWTTRSSRGSPRGFSRPSQDIHEPAAFLGLGAHAANANVAHAGADRLRERLATARLGGEIPSRPHPGDEPEPPRDDGSGEGSGEGFRDGSVVVKRSPRGTRGGHGRGAPDDADRDLPKANNVPRYTNYIYSAFENSYVEDEVRRRLLFPDHEGEMLEAGDSEDDSVSDSDSDSGSKSGSGSPGRSPRLSVGATPPSDAADRKAKKKEEERPRKEEEDAENAAAGPWDRKDDTSSSRPRPSSAFPTAPSRASRKTSSSSPPWFARG